MRKHFSILNHTLSWLDVLLLLALFALIYQPLFGHLGRQPFHIWDEARLSRNALEMYKDWHWLTPTFDGSPDMWNSKPPLLIWLQALSFKYFGLNELSFRLPSALASLILVLLLCFISSRYLRSLTFGIIASLVLITSVGFIFYHAARSGDYDALLCLWTSVVAFSFFAYTETDKPKYLYLLSLAVVAGILTKGIAVFMMGPGLLAFSLYRRKFIRLLKSKHLYLALAIILLFGVSYYPIREMQNPGYMQAVWDNELGGRFLETNDYHSGPFFYYLDNLWQTNYSFWLPLAILGFILAQFFGNSREKTLGAFAGITALCYFLVVSIGKTKLLWYDIPLYPFLAILTALGIYQTANWLWQSAAPKFLAPVLVMFILYWPYRNIIDLTYQPQKQMDATYYSMSFYLQDAFKGKIPFYDQVIVFEGYHTQLDFYIELLRKKGYKLDYSEGENLQIGQQIAVYHPNMYNLILAKYETVEIGSHGLVKLYRIQGLR